MDLFKDKTAIVTGGASGIGRGICEQLGERGTVVIVADINRDGAEKVASGINKTGGQAQAAHLDVSQAQQIQNLIDEALSRYGRLDYMFNNAGINVRCDARDMTLDHWQRVIGVNLWGIIFGTTSAYSVMVRQGFGHIVNTASLAGLAPIPMSIQYCTTKHAVVGLSTSLRAEGAALGVKVSVVCPGFVQTGLFDATTHLNVDKEKQMADLPSKMIDATEAAKTILKGVVHNQPIIVFPSHARFFWWMHRIHPSILSPLLGKMVRDFRASRLEA